MTKAKQKISTDGIVAKLDDIYNYTGVLLHEMTDVEACTDMLEVRREIRLLRMSIKPYPSSIVSKDEGELSIASAMAKDYGHPVKDPDKFLEVVRECFKNGSTLGE
jgi:hypothetical protein